MPQCSRCKVWSFRGCRCDEKKVVYVACASQGHALASKVMDWLQADENLQVAHRWDAAAAAFYLGGDKPTNWIIAAQRRNAVKTSNVMLLLFQQDLISVGIWVELGIALAREIPIICVHLDGAVPDLSQLPPRWCWLDSRSIHHLSGYEQGLEQRIRIALDQEFRGVR